MTYKYLILDSRGDAVAHGTSEYAPQQAEWRMTIDDGDLEEIAKVSPSAAKLLTVCYLPMDAIIGMGQALIPVIKDTFTFVCFAVVPFNVVKGIVISIITMLVYKHISPLLHR